MLESILEISCENVSIYSFFNTMTRRFIILPVASIAITISFAKHSLSLSFRVNPFSLIVITRGMCELAKTMWFIIFPLPSIDCSIWPSLRPISVPHIILNLPMIRDPRGKSDNIDIFLYICDKRSRDSLDFFHILLRKIFLWCIFGCFKINRQLWAALPLLAIALSRLERIFDVVANSFALVTHQIIFDIIN